MSQPSPPLSTPNVPPKAESDVRPVGDKVCTVCKEQQSKYKCSRCETPYCSVPCATIHRATPCELSPARQAAAQPSPPVEAVAVPGRPGTVSAAKNGSMFAVLEHSQKLQTLFVLYPRLRSQLRQIYNATLPPSDDTTVRQSDLNFPSRSRASQHMGGRAAWNNDIGTQAGIDALAQAKADYGKDGEALREYADLVLKLVTADGVNVTQLVEDEVAEENAKIIAQLLSGGV